MTPFEETGAAGQVALYGTWIIFNLSTLWTVGRFINKVDIASALAEKDPRVLQARVSNAGDLTDQANVLAKQAAGLADPGARQQLLTAAQQSQDAAAVQVTDDTSFSRAAGAIGAMVLSCLFWGIGNIIIYKMIAEPSGLEDLLGSVRNYFLTGATLFAPYAVNQLRSIVTPKP